MKRKKRGSYPGIQIGTSYLLVIFVILCLVTFATLSLSSAKRDAFAKEDPVFAIRQIEGVTAEEDGANLDISYVVPVTDSQNLEVEILADPVKGTQKVVKWKESASEKWEEKSTLPVLGSD